MNVLGVALAVGLPHLAFAQPTDDTVSFAAAPAPAVAYKAVSKESNKKINMVIATLKDILQSVVNEEKEETAMYNKYVAWCDTESAAIAKDLKDTKTELANAKVLNQEQLSSIDSLTNTVNKNEKEMEETKDAVAQAVALRTDENEKYTEEMQLNTESLRQIDTAIKHVSKVNKQGGFLQNGVLKKLAVNQPGESSYVLGIMKGLEDKLKKSRAELESVEKEKVKMHNSFMDTTGKRMKEIADETTEKKILLSETTAKQAGTKRKIGKLTDEVTTLTDNGIKTAETCQTAKHEWSVRQADRTKEKAALNEAVRYLSESSFEQLSLMQESNEEVKSEEERAPVVFAPSFVQTVSDTKSSDNAFFAAASSALLGEDEEVEAHAKKDTFTGVKSVVQKLIASHQSTQQEEKDKKEYCEKEIEAKDDEKATTTDDLAAVKADIDTKTAESSQLADEVKQLYAAIDEIKASLEKAGKIRKEEAALFAASSKDRALALKVLNQAKQVLEEFYKNAFFQKSAHKQAPQKWAPGNQRKDAAASGAVSMVQGIADDITKEQKDAAADEAEAAGEYARLQQDSAT